MKGLQEVHYTITGKHTALSDSKRLEKEYTSSLTAHLKALEQKKKIHTRGVDSRKSSNSGLKSTK